MFVMKMMLAVFGLLFCQTVQAGTITDYQLVLGDLARHSSSSKELTTRLSALYGEIDNNLADMAVESDEYDPEKIDYASILFYTLAPFAAEKLIDGEIAMGCDEYQNYLIYGYREQWQDMPEAVHDCWQLIKQVCREE
jgi:hypothetical protein